MRALPVRASAALVATLFTTALFAPGAAAPADAEIFVGSDTEILVFADDASGDVVPLRKISGLLTELPAVFTLSADRVHRELWVSGCLGIPSILVFGMDDEGDVAPRRRISGAQHRARQRLRHDPRSGARRGLRRRCRRRGARLPPARRRRRRADADDHGRAHRSHAADDGLPRPRARRALRRRLPAGAARVRVFARTAADDVAPLRTLTLSGAATGNPRGLLVDLENDELIVVDLGRNAVRFYTRTASGTTACAAGDPAARRRCSARRIRRS